MHFLQSHEWEKFQQALGYKTWRIQGVLIIKHNLIFGKTWLYIPKINISQFDILCLSRHGSTRAVAGNMLEQIKSLAKSENAVFLKIEIDEIKGAVKLYQILNFGFVKSIKHIQPKKTMILSLDQSKEMILNKMRRQTRYSVRYAEKQGIKIRISDKANTKQFKKDFENFYELMQKTAKKHKFKIYNKDYYFKFLQMPIAELFLAEIKRTSWHTNFSSACPPKPSALPMAGAAELARCARSNSPRAKNLMPAGSKMLAGNIVVFYKQRAYGIHGAGSAEMRNLRASYLMQWHRICHAKNIGCRHYDFWGTGHQWPGITKFKKGFGGQEVEYISAYDMIFNRVLYKFYRFYQKLRRF